MKYVSGYSEAAQARREGKRRAAPKSQAAMLLRMAAAPRPPR